MSLEHLGKNRREQLLQWGHHVGQTPNVFLLGYLSQALDTNWSMFVNATTTKKNQNENQLRDEQISVLILKLGRLHLMQTQRSQNYTYKCEYRNCQLSLASYLFKRLLLKQTVHKMRYRMFYVWCGTKTNQWSIDSSSSHLLKCQSLPVRAKDVNFYCFPTFSDLN